MSSSEGEYELYEGDYEYELCEGDSSPESDRDLSGGAYEGEVFRAKDVVAATDVATDRTNDGGTDGDTDADITQSCVHHVFIMQSCDCHHAERAMAIMMI